MKVAISITIAVASCVLSVWLAGPIDAKLFPTSPVGTTEWSAGQRYNVTWKDSGEAPHSDNLTYRVELKTGGRFQQFVLRTLAKRVSGRRQRFAAWIPKNIGPDGNYYFLQFTANNDTDTTWSAHFTINNATGSFNETVLAATQQR